MPDLDLPLIRVLAPEALLPDSAPEATAQSLEQALAAVAEAAAVDLDQAKQTAPSGSDEMLPEAVATPAESEFIWEPAPAFVPEPATGTGAGAGTGACAGIHT